MVLKKPYAFLIKYFKVIHFILFATIIFITTKYYQIVNFFFEYTNNNNLIAGINLLKRSLTVSIFLAVVIVIVFSFLMLILMIKKNKPSKFYLLTGAYYLVLLGFAFHYYSIIEQLESSTIPLKTALAYRDISLIVFLPNFYFIVASLIRALGFDIKKFNFSKDLEELEIKNEDNEEFEFIIGTDFYKVKRNFRKRWREFIYYVKENKLFISFIVGGLGLFVIITILLNITFFNKVYHVGSTAKANGITYKLNNAYVTSTDMLGNNVKEGKKYVILDMTVKSNSGTTSIKQENLYLKKGKEFMQFTSTYTSSFKDLGKAYLRDKITNEPSNYLFVFEVDEKSKGSYELKIFDKIEYKNNEQEYKYVVYKFKPKTLEAKLKNHAFELNKEITFNDDFFGKTTLNIKDIKYTSYYEYSYDKCDNNNENCVKNTGVEFPISQNQNNMMVIDYDLNIDQKSSLYNAIGNNKDKFFDNYLKVTYTKDNKTYVNNTSAKLNKYLDNIVFADIPKNIEKKNNYKVVIMNRYDSYVLSS